MCLPLILQMQLSLNSHPVANILKRETAALHQQVEAVLLPRLTAIKSLEDYISILKMFYGFFHPMEQRVQAFITSSVLADVVSRRTSLLILDDLKFLQTTHTDLPQCRDLPDIENVTAAFGAMYVLEGSTLGGKMIARMLAKNSAYQVPQEALHFFNGYKENTGVMWTNFLTELNKQPDTEAIISAANGTFFHLKNWMKQP